MKNSRAESHSDSRWLFAYAVFLSAVTLLPYAIALGRGNPDWTFTGFLIGVDDGNSYIAKMLTGAAGSWLFRTPYTTVPQAGTWFVFLPYVLLGKLAAGPETHLQLIVLFQIYRIVSIFLLVFAGNDFIGLFIRGQPARRTGVVLLTAGGGLGWLLVLLGRVAWFGSLPLDFYSPETFGFLAVFGLPHLVAGRALLLWGITVYLRARSSDGLDRAGLQAGLLWLAAGLFSPINPALAWLVTGAYLAVTGLLERGERWRGALRRAIVAGAISAPLVGYLLLASNLDSFFRAWSAQNRILSPHPLHYLLAYGMYLPFALAGARRLLTRKAPVAWYPIVWTVLVPVLAYLPYNLQRRLPEGAFAALLVLFLAAFDVEGKENRLRRRDLVLPAAALGSSLFLLAGSFRTALAPGPPAFRPSGETTAFAWLADHADVDEVVLAPVPTGNALPAFTPQRVVIGHGPETIGFERLQPLVAAFFSGELSPAEQAALLDSQGVDYVLGPAATPVPPGSVRVYAEQGYVIFRVEH